MNTPAEAPSVVMVDQGQIYALLLEVRDDVRDMKKDLSELAHDSRDHENRLRTVEASIPTGLTERLSGVEARVWKFMGGATVLGAASGFLLNRLLG